VTYFTFIAVVWTALCYKTNSHSIPEYMSVHQNTISTLQYCTYFSKITSA